MDHRGAGRTEPVLVTLPDGMSCYTTPERFELFSEIDFIHAEIFEEQTYLRHGTELPQRPVVVDVGANIGLFTLFVTQQRPEAAVLACEPMPDTLAALQGNLALHETAGATVSPHALGKAREDAVAFTFYPRLPGNSTRYPADKSVGEQVSVALIGEEQHREAMRAEQVPVDVRRFSEVVAEWGRAAEPGVPLDLVKIDVDGAELDVLEGIEPDDWARTRQFVIEVQDLGGRLDEVRKLLEGHGFEVRAVRPENLADEFRYHMVHARRG